MSGSASRSAISGCACTANAGSRSTASATRTARSSTAAIALAFFAYMARVRMWQSTAGELVWFLIVAFVVYALMEVFRHSRAY